MHGSDKSFSELFQQGLNAARARNLASAAESFDRAIEIDPDHAAAHGNRGAVHAELKQWLAALASYDRAIALNADYAVAHSNRGNALKELKLWEPALASYDRAIEIKPDLAEAYSNRGAVLNELERWDAALASCDQAIAINPDMAEAYVNRGIVLGDLKRFDAALTSYGQALAINAGYSEAFCNRGIALHELGRLEAALGSYDRAIELKPDFAEAHFNRSITLLTAGDFENGWRGYEWRWRNEKSRNMPEKRRFVQPLWLGSEPIDGKRILLHSEQGLGDTLQFCRYAQCVADLGAEVILEVQQPLANLLGQLGGVSRVVVKGGELPPVDYQCPLMSLPLALKSTLATIPGSSGYLRSDVAKVAQWRARLREKVKPRIGLMWSGSAANRKDRDRSIHLADLIEWLPGGFEYINLQKDVRERDLPTLRANPQILSFCDDQKDFDDAAALCDCMDLVISVDTSVAHLGGALGRRTWVLLAYGADWRWLRERDTSPWYDSAKLYRQAAAGDWRPVFERMAADLGTAFK